MTQRWSAVNTAWQAGLLVCVVVLLGHVCATGPAHAETVPGAVRPPADPTPLDTEDPGHGAHLGSCEAVHGHELSVFVGPATVVNPAGTVLAVRHTASSDPTSSHHVAPGTSPPRFLLHAALLI